MYEFIKFQFDWLLVYVAKPSVNDVLKKRFSTGVTPQNQSTLNIYSSGKFKASVDEASFSQVLGIGESSLDLSISEFPNQAILVETPVEEPACRLCLSVNGGGKWAREKRIVAAKESIDLAHGQVAVFIPATGWIGDGVPPVHVESPFVCSADGTVFLLQKS